MIKFIKLSLIFFALNITATVTGQEKQIDFDENFTHVVYFWLNEPENTEDRTAFETSLKNFLNNSLYAKTRFIGTPANTPREVVDNSYTYSLILTFPSKEIQNKYQTEKAHLKFIAESEKLWKKVQVYDSVRLE